MTLVVKGKTIFVNDKETRNPELIGLAFLDSVDSKKLDKVEAKKQLIKYFSKNGRRTKREVLIDVVLGLETLDALKIYDYCRSKEIKISLASMYNFIKDCKKSEILKDFGF